MSWNLAASVGAATWISASDSEPSLSTSAADHLLDDRTSLLLPVEEEELWLEAEFAWS